MIVKMISYSIYIRIRPSLKLTSKRNEFSFLFMRKTFLIRNVLYQYKNRQAVTFDSYAIIPIETCMIVKISFSDKKKI